MSTDANLQRYTLMVNFLRKQAFFGEITVGDAAFQRSKQGGLEISEIPSRRHCVLFLDETPNSPLLAPFL